MTVCCSSGAHTVGPSPPSSAPLPMESAGFNLGGGGGTGFLAAPDAERMVESLRAFGVEDVGSPAWTAQREAIERLNVQAHPGPYTLRSRTPCP